jgi:hypothetical protein
LRQVPKSVDRLAQRIDHAPEPTPGRQNLRNFRFDERLATHAHAVEIRERHRERPAVPKPYNLSRDILTARSRNREPSPDRERVNRPCYFYEQSLDACYPAVTPETGRRRHCRDKRVHE